MASALDSLGRYRQGVESALPEVSEIVCELLDAYDAGTYRLSYTMAGWELDHQHWHRGLIPASQVPDALRNAALGKVIAYDPSRPEPAQRNRFLRPAALRSIQYEKLEGVRIAGTGNDQLRALVCEGEQLLAWFGAFREVPFNDSERALMNQLIPSLCQRLALEHRFEHAALAESALAVALQRLAGAAFVLDEHARPLFANQTARALLDEQRSEWLTRLRRAVELRRAGLDAAQLSVTPLVLSGAPSAFIAVFSGETGEALKRLAQRTREWKLTPQQGRVVERLARGDTNKMIARALGCSVRTVEHHVAAATAKARVATRSELVAKFWSST